MRTENQKEELTINYKETEYIVGRKRRMQPKEITDSRMYRNLTIWFSVVKDGGKGNKKRIGIAKDAPLPENKQSIKTWKIWLKTKGAELLAISILLHGREYWIISLRIKKRQKYGSIDGC